MLEGFLAKAILMRLDTPEMLAELNRAPAGNEEAVAVAEQIEADTARKKSLAEDWADGLISRDDWLNANARIEPRLVANHAALARLTQRDKVAAYAGHGKELRERWDSLNLSRQVAIVKAVLDHAVILPATTPGRRGLDPDRVEPVWGACAAGARRGRVRAPRPSNAATLPITTESVTPTASPCAAQVASTQART
jgi:hypothetical protein